MLSARGLCLGLITPPEKSYRVWRVCDREALIMKRALHTRGSCALVEKIIGVNTLSLLAPILGREWGGEIYFNLIVKFQLDVLNLKDLGCG